MKNSSLLRKGAAVSAFTVAAGALTAAFIDHNLPVHVPATLIPFGLIGAGFGLFMSSSATVMCNSLQRLGTMTNEDIRKTNEDIRNGLPPDTDHVGRIISGGMGCMSGALGLIAALIIQSYDFPQQINDAFSKTANESFGPDWAMAKQGTSLKVKTSLSPDVSVPTKIAINKKEQTIYAAMYKGNAGPVYVRTCITFNASNDIPVDRPFSKKLEACTQRDATLDEIGKLKYSLS